MARREEDVEGSPKDDGGPGEVPSGKEVEPTDDGGDKASDQETFETDNS
jgi:hypothetical protein